MSKDNSGPAFPIPGDQQDESFNGMTLRDYFAAKAMQGELSSQGVDREYRGNDAPWLAEFAYQVADAMIAARK